MKIERGGGGFLHGEAWEEEEICELHFVERVISRFRDYRDDVDVDIDVDDDDWYADNG